MIEPAIKEFEDSEFEMVPAIEKKITDLVKAGKNDEAKQFVTTCTNTWAFAAMKKWEDMKGPLWTIVSRGY
jgi:hypothetical protein